MCITYLPGNRKGKGRINLEEMQKLLAGCELNDVVEVMAMCTARMRGSVPKLPFTTDELMAKLWDKQEKAWARNLTKAQRDKIKAEEKRAEARAAKFSKSKKYIKMLEEALAKAKS